MWNWFTELLSGREKNHAEAIAEDRVQTKEKSLKEATLIFQQKVADTDQDITRFGNTLRKHHQSYDEQRKNKLGQVYPASP